MGKARIYELAKELNVDSKIIIDKLKEMNVDVKNHMSSISEEVSEKVKSALHKKTAPVAKPVEKKTEIGKDENKEMIQKSTQNTNGHSGQKNADRKEPNKERQEKGDHRSQSRPQPNKSQNRPQGQNQNNQGNTSNRNNRNNSSNNSSNSNSNNNNSNSNNNNNSNQTHQNRSNRDNASNNHRDNNSNKNRENNQKKNTGTQNTSGGNPNVKKNHNQNGDHRQPNKSTQNKTQQSGARSNEQPVKEVVEERYQSFGGGQSTKQKSEQISRTKRAENTNKFGNKYDKGGKGKNFKGRGKNRQSSEQPREFAEVKHHVILEELITVQELARQLGKKATDVIMKLMAMGVMATINQDLDVDTATIIAEEFGATVEVKTTKEEELLTEVEIEDKPEDLVHRPPVVTIMGHVDHGKTSLLDKIRSASVTSTEAGGITQHIGAYQVEAQGQKITFLDTPGHEAFTAMRARGAQVTDIAILVVAADDGVMPQTIEAIDHAKAAGVPIIIAINKIDKPEANPDKIKQELTNYGLVSEEWGGDTIMVPVSAKAGLGIEELLEMILLVAEVADLKANPKRNARGKVVESKLDKGRGPVATLLVQTGTLHVGDFLIVGTTQGRIRAMFDYNGRQLKTAAPSVPVEILGLNEVPVAGDDFIAVDNEKLAKQVADKRQKEKHQQEIARNTKVTLEDIFAQIKEGEMKELNIILKADVQGSIEAIRQSLEKIGNAEVRVNIIRTAVGGIREADVMLAAASNAIIIGFNVRPDVNAKKLAEKEAVEVKTYRVIYEAIDDVKAALSGLLTPDLKEVELGQAEIRTIFRVPKIGAVAGCYVTDGKMVRNAKIRVVRDSVVIHDGVLASLKRFKDDVKEVATGYECGLSVENFNDIKEGDILEAYTFEEIKREL